MHCSIVAWGSGVERAGRAELESGVVAECRKLIVCELARGKYGRKAEYEGGNEALSILFCCLDSA